MNDKKLGRVNNCGFAGVEGLYETRFTWSLEHDSYQWSSSNAHRFMGCMDTLGEDPATPQFGEYPSCTTPKCAYVGVRLGSGEPRPLASVSNGLIEHLRHLQPFHSRHLQFH